VFQAKSGTVVDPTAGAAITQTVANLGKVPHATGVGGPVGPSAAGFISPDKTIAFARVQYDAKSPKVGTDALKQLEVASAPAQQAGLRVEYGGPVVDYANRPSGGHGDVIGVGVAVVILLFAFGSVVAMGLPIGTALFGLLVGLSLIGLISAFTDVGTIAPVLGTMIGLGVGIDYSLFIVTRHREGLKAGLSVEEASGEATATAGQAVLFAGCTVVIAVCGLAISGIPYVAMLGYMAALVVAVMILAALTLLPALIGLAGPWIDRWHVHGFHRRGPKKPSSPGAGGSEEATPRHPVPIRGGALQTAPEFDGDVESAHGWAHFALIVAKSPWPWAIGALVVLLTLAAPATKLRLGQTDDGTAPSSSTQRHAYDLLAKGFGPGFNGPLVVSVALPGPGQTQVLTPLGGAIQQTPGVAQVAPPQLNQGQDTAVIYVIPKSAPDSSETSALVSDLHDNTIPPVVGTTGAKAYVGGQTAAFIDLGNRISARLLYFIGAVVLLSFFLLLVVFHSLLVPLTAAVMNLLSVGAAYGVVVAVFQFGWGKGLFGLEATVPIVSYVPMMLFAILFGLSMDYQVFLLTRVHEEYEASGDNRYSVVKGVGLTARVITSAALIMISVFLSFVANPQPEVKMFGLGLAVAVLVDSTIVRMILVPAVMELFGKANWWLPGWMERVLPRVHLE
jgi:RND superfamily putative drug exporter